MTRMRSFTLVELLLVLSVAAVILGLSLPNLKKTYAGAGLRNSADKVVGAMRYAKGRALIEGRSLRMIMASDMFQLQLASRGQDASDDGYALLPGRMGRSVQLPEGVSFRSFPASVVFHPDGAVDPVTFEVAGDDRKLVVTTKEVPGHVVLLEPQEE